MMNNELRFKSWLRRVTLTLNCTPKQTKEDKLGVLPAADNTSDPSNHLSFMGGQDIVWYSVSLLT